MRGRRKRDSCKRSYGIKHQGVRHPEEIYGGLSALWYNTRRMVPHFKQVSFSSIQITHCDLDSPSATLYPTCVCTRNVEHLCTIASTQTWAGTSIVYSGLPEMHNLDVGGHPGTAASYKRRPWHFTTWGQCAALRGVRRAGRRKWRVLFFTRGT